MTAETDLLPMPWIERYAVVGDIAYPVSSDPDGDYVAHDDHAAAMQAYARACVSSATEALRAEVAKQSAYAKRTHDWNTDLLANNERLAEALREMLAFYGERVDAECRTKDWRELEEISAARAALDQETTNG